MAPDNNALSQVDEHIELGMINSCLNEGGEQFTAALGALLHYIRTNGFTDQLDPLLGDYLGWMDLIRKFNSSFAQLIEEDELKEQQQKEQEEKHKLDLIPKEINVDSKIIAQLVKTLISEYTFSVRVAFDAEGTIIIQILYENPQADIHYHTKQLEIIQLINWESLTSYMKPKFFKPATNGKFIVGEARVSKTNAIFKNWIETKLREMLAHKYPDNLLIVKYI